MDELQFEMVGLVAVPGAVAAAQLQLEKSLQLTSLSL